MIITPNRIVSAYKAIHELSGTVFPYREARGVAKLKKRLTEEFETVLGMEKSLVEEYGGKCASGSYQFPDQDLAERFRQVYSAAMEQEDDIPLSAVDLSKYTDTIRLSPGAVEALEGLVIFEKGEGANG